MVGAVCSLDRCVEQVRIKLVWGDDHMIKLVWEADQKSMGYDQVSMGDDKVRIGIKLV